MSRALLIACAGLLLLSCLALDSFLFEPTKVDEYFRPADMDTAWHVRGNVIPESLVEAVTLTSSGGNRIYGFLAKQASGRDSTATIIYCHGNAENINRYWGRVELLWEMGFQVFIFDYQGYGKSEGTPSGEALYSDGRAALEFCLGRDDVAESLLVYYGWSLGGFVATYLAADSIAPLGLILETPMASVSAIAKEGAVFDVPGSFLADADFDNETRIRRVACPVLILYGDQDETAVPERNAEVLIEKARGWIDLTARKAIGAAHDNLPETMGTSSYRRAVVEFVAGCREP